MAPLPAVAKAPSESPHLHAALLFQWLQSGKQVVLLPSPTLGLLFLAPSPILGIQIICLVVIILFSNCRGCLFGFGEPTATLICGREVVPGADLPR